MKLVFHGNEAWTISVAEKRIFEGMKLWYYTKIIKMKWTERIIKKEVLGRVGGESNLLKMTRKTRASLIGHAQRHSSLVKTAVERRIDGKMYRGRLRVEYMKQIMTYVNVRSYEETE